jgi:hypothetical protein
LVNEIPIWVPSCCLAAGLQILSLSHETLLERIDTLASSLDISASAVRKLLQEQPALLQQPSPRLQQALLRLQQLMEGKKKTALDVIKAHPKVWVLIPQVLASAMQGPCFRNVTRHVGYVQTYVGNVPWFMMEQKV